MCPTPVDKDNIVIDVFDDEEMEVEVITISDDEVVDEAVEEVLDEEDDDYDMYNPVYDREVNHVLDNIEDMDFEPDDVENEESEEEEEQPVNDDGYESDSRVIESSRERTFDNAQIESLSENSRMCVFFSYVALGGSVKLCVPCFMRNRERFASITGVERHETMRYRDVPHHHCIDCQERLFAIFLVNMCPVCQSRAAVESDNVSDDEMHENEE